jgi:hypothetical protein
MNNCSSLDKRKLDNINHEDLQKIKKIRSPIDDPNSLECCCVIKLESIINKLSDIKQMLLMDRSIIESIQPQYSNVLPNCRKDLKDVDSMLTSRVRNLIAQNTVKKKKEDELFLKYQNKIGFIYKLFKLLFKVDSSFAALYNKFIKVHMKFYNKQFKNEITNKKYVSHLILDDLHYFCKVLKTRNFKNDTSPLFACVRHGKKQMLDHLHYRDSIIEGKYIDEKLFDSRPRNNLFELATILMFSLKVRFIFIFNGKMPTPDKGKISQTNYICQLKEEEIKLEKKKLYLSYQNCPVLHRIISMINSWHNTILKTNQNQLSVELSQWKKLNANKEDLIIKGIKNIKKQLKLSPNSFSEVKQSITQWITDKFINSYAKVSIYNNSCFEVEQFVEETFTDYSDGEFDEKLEEECDVISKSSSVSSKKTDSNEPSKNKKSIIKKTVTNIEERITNIEEHVTNKKVKTKEPRKNKKSIIKKTVTNIDEPVANIEQHVNKKIVKTKEPSKNKLDSIII